MSKGNIILIIIAIIIIALLSFIAFYLWQISDQISWQYQRIIEMNNTLEAIKSDVYWMKMH